MRKCPSCGSYAPDYEAECRYCGAKFAGVGADSQQSQSQPYQQPYRQSRQQVHGNASSSQVLTLVMGILGVFCFPFAVIAIILWAVHRGKVKQGLAQPDGAATAGLVMSVIGIGLQVLVLIGVIAVWSVVGIYWHEGGAAGTLKQIGLAQTAYYRDKGYYAYSFDELKPYGIEDISAVESIFNYTFELEGRGDKWSVIARPLPSEVGKLRYLYIDQTGKIRADKSPNIGSHSPEFTLPDELQDTGDEWSG